MSARFPWWWIALAAVPTAVAVTAGSDYVVSAPSASLAVIVAVGAVLDAIRRLGPAEAPRQADRPAPRSRVRGWLAAGDFGREEIVLLLDRIERKALHPMLPARPPQEVAAIVRLPRDQFRRYVSDRLTAIEEPR